RRRAIVVPHVERAPDVRPGAQDVEKIRGNDGVLDLLRLTGGCGAPTGHTEPRIVERRPDSQRLERPGTLAHVEEVREGQWELRERARRAIRPNQVKARRIREGEGPEEGRVDDAEDRRVRADAQRER